MKLLDKFKNMFTDEVEEDDEVKVEQIKNEVTHVSIESPVTPEKEINKLEELRKESKPVFFDEKDFNDFEQYDEEEIKPKKREEKFSHKKEETIFKKDEEPVVEKKVFKPTPIISPIYGILDKNYHKEDIVSRSEPTEEKNIKEPTVDTIRNKAYGTLEDELENTLFGDTSILFKRNFQNVKEEKQQEELVDDDVLSNLTDDISKELDELLTKKEKYSDDENDINETNDVNDEDLLGFIDSTLYKRGDE